MAIKPASIEKKEKTEGLSKKISGKTLPELKIIITLSNNHNKQSFPISIKNTRY